ncbi:MAG: heme exporter protein CcmD [Pseudomonadota bacterium]
MNQVSEFFEMGGYALYVWGSFGVTAVLMVAEPLLLRKRRAEILKRLARIARMNAKVTK